MAGTIAEITGTVTTTTGTVWSEVEQDGTSKKFRAIYANNNAPTVNDDVGDSFAVGSVWIDYTNQRLYVATSVSSGAAVWLGLQSYDADLVTLAASISANGLSLVTAANYAAMKALLAYAGAEVSNTPAGNIAATTIQAAINELDTEKAALAGATFTGPVLVPEGSVSAVALRVGSASSTGFYLTASGSSGELGVANNGANVATFAMVSGRASLLAGGAETPIAVAGSAANQPALQAIGTGFNASTLLLVRNSADTLGPKVMLAKTRDTTLGASSAAALSGDVLGDFTVIPCTGSGLGTTTSGNGGMQIVAQGDWSSGATQDLDLLFRTTAAGSVTTRAKIRANGDLTDGSSNVWLDANRHWRRREYAAGSLPSQDDGDTIGHADINGAALISDGTEWLGDGVVRLRTVANDTTISIPAGCAISAIHIENTTANAVTGGIKIGTSSGATDVVAAQAVGANAKLTIAESAVLLKWFSRASAQTLYIQDVTAWNSASLEISVVLKKVF